MRSIKYTYYAILLLSVMLLNVFKYQVPVMEYALFKGYIAENLCVNRFQTHNSCQGKCHLKKQLILVEESDTDAQPNRAANGKKLQLKEYNDFYCSHHFSIQPVVSTLIQPENLEATILQGFASAFFVPPKANLF